MSEKKILKKRSCFPVWWYIVMLPYISIRTFGLLTLNAKSLRSFPDRNPLKTQKLLVVFTAQDLPRSWLPSWAIEISGNVDGRKFILKRRLNFVTSQCLHSRLIFTEESKDWKKGREETGQNTCAPRWPSEMDQLQALNEAPTSTNSTELETSSKIVINLWYWISAGLIELLILLANGLLAFLIVKSPSLHNSANWFILSLAVSDLFFGVVVIPSSMMCNLWLSCNNDVRWLLTDLVVYVSIANVCVMSLDRLAAVEFPMRYHSLVVPRVKLWIILSWVVPAIVSAFPFCWMFAEAGAAIVKINKIFRAVQLFAFELLPCAVMLIVHGRIFLIRRKHSQQIILQRTQLNVETNLNENRERSNFRAEKFLGVTATLVFFYVFCWIFSAVLTSCHYFEMCEVSRAALLATSLLVFLSPAVNALICLFMKSDIRKDLWKLFWFILRTLIRNFKLEMIFRGARL